MLGLELVQGTLDARGYVEFAGAAAAGDLEADDGLAVEQGGGEFIVLEPGESAEL